ncbi:MAG: LysM peptidoglycan-binding domain-containing protein [Acetatifactor sp.]|nr:LysM peptidoglycan-binding domain-containing protein [Acetatifactor sp.]
MYIDKVLFPVTPAKLKVKINNQNRTITLINEGEVNLIKSPGLSDIEIDELLLPAFQKYQFAHYGVLRDKNKEILAGDGEFHNAKYYIEELEKWKKEKKPVQFVMSRTTPNGEDLLWDTNFDVTIEDYEIIEDVEKYGFDVAVRLSMKQYESWGAKKLVLKKKNSSGKKSALMKKRRNTTKVPAKSYTVKKGDCLVNIAKKQLGNASKYKSIYNLNKKTIESTAKRHGRKSSSNGHWIYPGTKLKLPS